MAREPLHPAISAFARNAECRDPSRELRRFLHALQAPQGGNHLAASGKLGTAGVGAKLTTTGEGHDDHRGQHAEHDLQHEESEVIAHARTFLILENHPVDKPANDPRNEDHESVDDTLDQRQRDHVAIGHMGHLVAKHGLRFISCHALQQSGRDGDERMVTVHAGGKGIDLVRLVDGDFRHADARRAGLASHRINQPGFGGCRGVVDHVRADRHLR